MKLSAFVLTGGQGTRLRPLTLYAPKPLLPIANIPFLSYLLDYLRYHFIHEVVLCTSDSFKPYQNLAKQEKKLGTVLLGSGEKHPLGTAGALKNAEKMTDLKPSFILNGDVLTNINLTQMLEFHRLKGSKLTIALIPVTDPSAYGLTHLDSSGKIIGFQEKPAALKINRKKTYWINAGIYIFEKEIFGLIPPRKNVSTEKELFPKCLEMKIPVYGYMAKPSDYWLDIGTPQKYLKANEDALAKRLPENFNNFKQLGDKTKIGKDVIMQNNVIIGNQCKIGREVFLRNCVILDRVEIDYNSTIENCIIGSHVKIGHHTKVVQSRIVGNYSIVTPYSQI